ncbi:hypothetical protein Pla175_14880 [Pirellulimonas nuda]|uniref:Uncharacterized protein n=1 Tax=Pirellulimonas nuda TaxID=2528009 RepID=A0A518D9E7_9BACT|nr:hypothetical protein [Pirellulimonas nuda]QDU88117.1 hypothetical protein Pla175_14880 [Pirellulimonas nuda]
MKNPNRLSPTLMALLAAAFIAAPVGCKAFERRDALAAPGPPAPQVLAPAASVNDIVAAVNANTARVQNLMAGSVSLTLTDMPNLPLLSGTLSAQRPRRLRLRAGTSFTGPEIDLGSNDELFWVWIRQNQPPGVYFARHDQLAGSAAQQWLPIPPEWLLDAIGLVQLDPAAAYQGPLPRQDGTLEITSTETGPAGPLKRVTVVDPTRGWVVEQHLYDTAGQLLASATARKFRYDVTAQASLPSTVSIRVPRANLAFTLDMANVSINQPVSDPAAIYGLPTFEGTPQIDLGRAGGAPIGAAPPSSNAAPVGQLRSPAGYTVPTAYTSPLPAPQRELIPLQATGEPPSVTQAPETMPVVDLGRTATEQTQWRSSGSINADIEADGGPQVERLPPGGVALPLR